VITEQTLKKNLLHHMGLVAVPGPYSSLVDWFRRHSRPGITVPCSIKEPHFHIQEQSLSGTALRWIGFNSCWVLNIALVNPQWTAIEALGEMAVARQVLAGKRYFGHNPKSTHSYELREKLLKAFADNQLLKAKTIRGILNHKTNGRLDREIKKLISTSSDVEELIPELTTRLNQMVSAECGPPISIEGMHRNKALGYIAIISCFTPGIAHDEIANYERKTRFRDAG